MSSYTTRAKVKQALRIPAAITVHDSYIDELLTDADELVNGYLGVAGLTVTSYNETHDIMASQDWVALTNRPITSVAALTDNGQALVEGTDFYADSATGYLRLLSSVDVFTVGRQKVSVTYSAGYATVPSDIVRAATMAAAAQFNVEGHSGLESERTASYSYKVDGHPSGLPAQARARLNRYVRVMGFGSQGAP